jgi:hypothetical protein
MVTVPAPEETAKIILEALAMGLPQPGEGVLIQALRFRARVRARVMRTYSRYSILQATQRTGSRVAKVDSSS